MERDDVVVNVPRMVHAETYPVEGGRLLSVYRSELVKDTSPSMATIVGIVEETCNVLLSAEWVDDPEMMFGRALQTYRKVWAECPGASIEHLCGPSAANLDQEARDHVQSTVGLPQG